VHSYDEWVYVEGEFCEGTRTCVHCGDVDEEERHQLEKIGEYEEGNDIEVCSRCEYEA
jgi:hypothetical protein